MDQTHPSLDTIQAALTDDLKSSLAPHPELAQYWLVRCNDSSIKFVRTEFILREATKGTAALAKLIAQVQAAAQAPSFQKKAKPRRFTPRPEPRDDAPVMEE